MHSLDGDVAGHAMIGDAIERHDGVEDWVVGRSWWSSLGSMMLYRGGAVGAVGRAFLLVLGCRSWAT